MKKKMWSAHFNSVKCRKKGVYAAAPNFKPPNHWSNSSTTICHHCDIQTKWCEVVLTGATDPPTPPLPFYYQAVK